MHKIVINNNWFWPFEASIKPDVKQSGYWYDAKLAENVQIVSRPTMLQNGPQNNLLLDVRAHTPVHQRSVTSNRTCSSPGSILVSAHKEHVRPHSCPLVVGESVLIYWSISYIFIEWEKLYVYMQGVFKIEYPAVCGKLDAHWLASGC